MEDRSFGDRGRVRIMLWAAAILFLLNFYMFVAARTAPATIEIVNEPLSATAPVQAPRCFVSTRVQAIPSESERLIEVRRVLKAERTRLRERTEKFGKPELRVRVVTPSAG
ncbi:MAG: hypothetical protein KJO98_00180 [Rhodothermia bacterium]|nr:hypothetical protein [Rhodothermia bacterium]